ncbi:hypothetical protein [Pseudoduganella violaceinigra]|uniref:hypothetical protein n=1 Tax=Pseudoduganella violaceinigra TaxID=246602 RepID=UPI00042531B6|nr:hypothetical protein [Pseudoduganella violaceinigra]
MDGLLDTIRQLRAVPHAPWRMQVRRVAVILTSSRSGSTLFKAALARHPGIASLDGEAEPFLALSGNGFGCDPACSSDAIARLRNADALADEIFDGLTVPASTPAPLAEMKARWRKRLLLQFPALFALPARYAQLERALDEALLPSQWPAVPGEQELQDAVLGAVYWREPWRLDYYDASPGPGERRPFGEDAKIEEPPFVSPSMLASHFAQDDAASKVLLFKTPSDAYRFGLYEQLFPQAQVRYLHLARSFAACVNGMMDGWLSPTGFHAHDMQRQGVELGIGGYSDQCAGGRRWWKFDLPPNWRSFINAPLEEVCLNQWLSCHRHIFDSGVAALPVRFESFLADPAAVLERACEWLDLPPLPQAPQLPITMATEAPAPGRWRKRSAELLPLAQRAEVADMMHALGYGMAPERWQ